MMQHPVQVIKSDFFAYYKEEEMENDLRERRQIVAAIEFTPLSYWPSHHQE
jgi:hypothetical protein